MKKEFRMIKKMLILIIRALLTMIKSILTILYIIEKAKNNLIAKLFMKMPRLAKVITIYVLVGLSILSVVNIFPSENANALNVEETTKVVEKVETIEEEKTIVETEKETTKQEEPTKVVETKKCNFTQETACKIYAKATEKGLTHEQATIVVSISAHETGWWKSNAFTTKNNFGGVMGSNGLKSYSSFEEGLEGFVNLLATNYFGKGLNTIEKIGAKYCPVGAKNDTQNVNKDWVPSVTSIYNKYV
jgi:hypothetical protein